ncbi:helix-turn-helix transcriptional regulator [Longispora sp. NPDC051575]|uniref:helix-turn-helix domain-containing protein n=1 Tax=Longispora sp. NPDC051575 TaxID=3154943 RepID=UPI003429C065
MADPQDARDARQALGRSLSALRQASGHTQTTLAGIVHYGRSTIANVETGRQNVPRTFWLNCDDELRAGGALVEEYDQLQDLLNAAQRRAALGAANVTVSAMDSVVSSGSASQLLGHGTKHALGLESITEIAARLLSVKPYPAEAVLAVLELGIADVVGRYEREGPTGLVHELVVLRRLLDDLYRDEPPARLRHRLLRAAGQACGLLAYVAVNLGRPANADAYAVEGFALAHIASDTDLMAWVRGTQSFNAYYQGRFDLALAFARDGLAHALDGPQAIRLKVNGEARALASIGGRAREALAAVDAAYSYGERHEAPVGISPCISLGIYGWGRIVANAITVNQVLGRPQQVITLIGKIGETVQASDSDWSRSLVGLDHATALLQKPFCDVEQAMAVATLATVSATDNPITSVIQRAHALVAAAAPWSQYSAVAEFRERMQGLTHSRAAGR